MFSIFFKGLSLKQIKQFFLEGESHTLKIQSRSQLHSIPPNDETVITDINMVTVIKRYPIFATFKELGWALSVRDIFRFFDTQKHLLYQHFI